MSIGSEIRIPAGESTQGATAYAAIPQEPKRGVVVLHEIFGGREPEMREVVERFAERGYAAVLPVLFESPFRISCVRSAMQVMKEGKGPFAEEIRGARTWLCERTGLSPKQVGLIGFCLGGGFALALGQGWGAVSTNYGHLPAGKLLDGLAPTIGCYGGRDRSAGKNGPKVERALKKRGVPVETHTYPTVGHSFLTNGDHPIAKVLTRPVMHIRYDPQVAEQAWGEIFRFFDGYLGAAA